MRIGKAIDEENGRQREEDEAERGGIEIEKHVEALLLLQTRRRQTQRRVDRRVESEE